MKSRKFLAISLIAGLLSFSTLAMAADYGSIYCRGAANTKLSLGAYQREELSLEQVNLLPANIKNDLNGAKHVYSFQLVTSKDEIRSSAYAVGFESNGVLQVSTLNGSLKLRTFVDELAAQDTASSLVFEGQRLSMSCRANEW